MATKFSPGFVPVPGGVGDAPNPAAQALGRLGGSANTKAQRRQRQAAAKNAGRPGRVCVKCAQPVVGGHVDRALDESCGAHGWRWERAGVRHPAPVSVDRAALDEIAAMLDGTVDSAIARIVRRTGRTVRRVRPVAPKGGR